MREVLRGSCWGTCPLPTVVKLAFYLFFFFSERYCINKMFERNFGNSEQNWWWRQLRMAIINILSHSQLQKYVNLVTVVWTWNTDNNRSQSIFLLHWHLWSPIQLMRERRRGQPTHSWRGMIRERLSCLASWLYFILLLCFSKLLCFCLCFPSASPERKAGPYMLFTSKYHSSCFQRLAVSSDWLSV